MQFPHTKQTIQRRRSEVMKKRFVAFLLVLIMVLGMLPVSALAADGTIVYDGVTLYTNTKPRYFTFL